MFFIIEFNFNNSLLESHIVFLPVQDVPGEQWSHSRTTILDTYPNHKNVFHKLLLTWRSNLYETNRNMVNTIR